MPGWAVIPTIRVPEMETALDFYQNTLGFTVERTDPEGVNSALTRGDARIMIETPAPAGFYDDRYNTAIKDRIGSKSPIALYIEASDLDDLYSSLIEAGATIVDPLADRPWGQREFTVEDHVGTWLTFWLADAADAHVSP